MRRELGPVACLLLAALPSGTFAQRPSDSPGPPTVAPITSAPAYGTADDIVLTLHAWDFQPLDGRIVTGEAGAPGDFRKYCVSSTAPYARAYLEAPAHLPTGARIISIQLLYCDQNANDLISAALFSNFFLENSEVIVQLASTAEFVGCGSRGALVDHTVENALNRYAVEVNLPIGDPDVSFVSVQIHYRLQVSPPPGAATFGDVPTSHQFFQFIEALADSGITAGCGAGNFCPDAPLTRGQMAVFLAKALGLHWPN